MHSSWFRLNNRLIFAVFVPVIMVGLAVSFLVITYFAPPLTTSLQDQSDRALLHTADSAVTICEERLDDLLELRLENDPEMRAAYLQEAVHQIRATQLIHPAIHILIIKDGKDLLSPNLGYGKIWQQAVAKGSFISAGSIQEADFQGTPVRFISQPFPFWGLQLVSFISEDDYNVPVIQAKRIVFFGTFGVFSAVLITLLLLFLWRVNSPLKKIIAATEEVAKGRFVRADIHGDDEIARVGSAFNQMVSSLEKDQERIRTIMRELRDSEEQYRILTENTLAYVAVLSNGHCLFMNGRMLAALKYDRQRIFEHDFYELVHGEDRDHFREAIAGVAQKGGSEKSIECRILAADSEIIWVELQATRIVYNDSVSVLIHGIDVTASREEQLIREKLELQLEQAKRLEAIGTLAGGVAHDFNNMLGGIIGAAEMLALNRSLDTKAEKYRKIILESAGRAAVLTEQLLTFSRSNPKTSTPVDVHEIIRETLVLVKNTVDKRIVLETALEAESSTIIGDPSLLQNAILNLCINSAQAMKDGGTIRITSKVLELDETYCRASSFDLTPGSYIGVNVQDSGEGIPPELLPRVFEPFFTTKTQGKGTGLGLSSVYGTIKQHNGAVNVYSEVNRGTAFNLLLPLTDKAKASNQEPPELRKGHGRILVVDDEEAMRVTARAILEELGYETVLAGDGKQAVDIYDREQGTIDLVLLDMVMPVMNGRDCFKRLRQMNPGVRVILSSGFTREEDLKDMESEGLDGFIQKPYRSANLGEIVHTVLG